MRFLACICCCSVFLLSAFIVHGQDPQNLFFSSSYQNPAFNTNLQSHSLSTRSLQAGADTDFDYYQWSAAGNVHLPGIQSNVGLLYRRHEDRWASQRAIGLNLGHRFALNDSASLSVGLRLARRETDLYNLAMDPKFGDQIDPDRGFVLPTDEPYKSPFANRYRGDTATTGTLGFYYQTNRLQAGLSFQNPGVLEEGDVSLGSDPFFPLGINAFVARDYGLGAVTVSPLLQYHYRNKPTALNYNEVSVQGELHQVKPGLLVQLKEQYFLGLKWGMEITDVDFRSNGELRAGIYLWDQLMLQVRARYPATLFGAYPDNQFTLGGGINWLIGNPES
jgi:hypothetical protein